MRILNENGLGYRVYNCFLQSLRPTVKTIIWLLKLMIPISFIVMLLDYSGFLLWLSIYTAPLVKLMGLRGESALVLLTSGFLNIYSAIAVMQSISFSMREITILAVMCLISHNLIVETFLIVKAGQIHDKLSFIAVFYQWVYDSGHLILKIIVIISALNFLQRILNEFSITVFLSGIMSPILQFFGLPPQASFMWLIANIIGLAWGSSVLIDQAGEGKISRKEVDLLNRHIAISHSLLEDTLLFVALGVCAFWLIVPRLTFAFFVVWVYRLVFIREK